MLEHGSKVRDAGFTSLADYMRDNSVQLDRNMRRKIADTIRRVFKAKPKMTVDQCADAFRYIPKGASADYGKYSVGTYAVAYGPLRAVTERGVRVITISASTQLMKTSFLECVILYFIIVDPSTMILIQPTKNLAKLFSTRKVDPMIDMTPEARQLVTKKTTAMKLFYGGDLLIITGASENDVKMVNRRVCMSDEVETIEDNDAGDVVAQGEARVESHGDDSLCCRVSSPKMKDGPIEKSYQDGDKRKAFVACPACGLEQVLRWSINRGKPDERKLVRWDEDPSTGRWQPKTIRYHCADPDCDHPFTNAERLAAIQAVRWKQTKAFTCCDDKPELGGGFQRPEETRQWVSYFHESDGRHVVDYAICQVCKKQTVPNEHASFGRASRLYTPKTLTKLVRLWKEALNSPSKMQTFVNTELAEPWEQEEQVDWSVDGLAARLENFEFQVPRRASGLTAGVDVQETWVEITVVAWGRGNESWVVAHHRIAGDFDDFALQQQVHEVLYDEYTGVNGRKFRIEQAFVDSNYKTTSVYRFCKAREAQRVYASRGWNEQKNVHPIHPNNFRIAGSVKAKLHMIGTNNAKADFFSFLSRTAPGPGFIHLPKGRVDQQFLTGLLSERRVKVAGGFRYVEKHDGVRNEPLDTWCLAYAAGEGLRLAHKDVLLFDHWADEQGIGRQLTDSEAARFSVEARRDIDRATRDALKRNQTKRAPSVPMTGAQPSLPGPVSERDVAQLRDNQPQSAQSERPARSQPEGPSLPSRFPQIAARRSGTRGYGSPF